MDKKLTFFLAIALLPLNKLYSQVIKIQSEQEYNTLKKEHSKIILQCHADWCPACKKAAPLFDKLAENQASTNITFARIDIDAVPKIKFELSLIGVPTFAFIQNGKLVHTEVGVKDFSTFEQYMHNSVAKIFGS